MGLGSANSPLVGWRPLPLLNTNGETPRGQSHAKIRSTYKQGPPFLKSTLGRALGEKGIIPKLTADFRLILPENQESKT